MGNNPSTTARNFDEDDTDEKIIKKLIAEYRNLVLNLIENRKLTIAITHLHHDHIGYSAAFEKENITVFFPTPDINEDILNKFKNYDFQPFIPGEKTLSIGEIIFDTIPCPGHTKGSTLFVISTPLVSYNYAAAKSSVTYFVFSGDAMGSGSSVWFFSLEGLNQLHHHIDSVINKLENYTLSNKSTCSTVNFKGDLLFLAGHTWQYSNGFGLMNMNMEYIKSMQNLLYALSDKEKWHYDGDQGLSLEQWLKRGQVVIKAANDSGLYTAYFGTTLTSCAAITCPLPIMQEYAGF